MKKIVLVSLAFLFVLVGCGQKKEAGPATKTEKDTLQSALPVIENAEKNTVVTKTLVLPKSDDGSQQTQTITYKDKTFLSLTIQQKRPVSDELKTYIDQHGVEETQKALLEAEEKDETIIEARKLAGFKLETKQRLVLIFKFWMSRRLLS